MAGVQRRVINTGFPKKGSQPGYDTAWGQGTAPKPAPAVDAPEHRARRQAGRRLPCQEGLYGAQPRQGWALERLAQHGAVRFGAGNETGHADTRVDLNVLELQAA